LASLSYLWLLCSLASESLDHESDTPKIVMGNPKRKHKRMLRVRRAGPICSVA